MNDLGKRLTGSIRSNFPFALDSFQEKALVSLDGSRSVVLSAPTGAGKTVVGEIAIYFALSRQQRIFYTAPLKALSNQKYHDFKKLFGEARVGLLTGDQTINRDADIVVMTTEVYRNMLYADSAEVQRGPPTTENLFAVVFDEFHYLNDRDRGTVWEESVINSPSHVLLVALSATMSNAIDVRDWFSAVQGPTDLISSNVRPVPLSFSYLDGDGIVPLFENSLGKQQNSKGKARGFKRGSTMPEGKRGKDTKLHPKLLRKLRIAERAEGRRGRRNEVQSTEGPGIKEVTISKYKEISKGREKNRKRTLDLPSFPYVVRCLRRREMLPCIIFIFSRAGCDRGAMAASSEKHPLVSPEEQREIKARLDNFIKQRPGMVQKERLNLALQGIASHHAGLLPLWKLCIEEMFQDGLIKVVFATETLAAGINMPARTTVISSLSKRTGGDGLTALSTSEVLQMAGRAGRRGKDTQGYSVVLKSRNEGPKEAFKVLTAPVDALESKFSPSYGMVLNLLSTRPILAAKKLVDRSFGNFLRRKEAESYSHTLDGAENDSSEEVGIQQEREGLQHVLREANDILKCADEKLLRSYVKSLERVKAEQRALMYLVRQGETMNSELIEETLTFAPSGTKILLRERKSSKSTGHDRKNIRQEYSSAISAAASGDSGTELMSFFLGPRQLEQKLLGEDDARNESEEIEAVLLEMHAESAGILPTFVAVDADGRLRMFDHTAVSQLVYEADTIDVDSCAPGWREVALPNRSKWVSRYGEQYEAPLPDSLQGVVPLLQAWRRSRSINKQATANSAEKGISPYEDIHHPEITAQRGRLEHAKEMVQKHELHGREETAILLAAKRAIPKIEAILEGRTDPFSDKKRQQRKGTYKRYLRRGKTGTKSENGQESVSNSSWDDFMSLASVLQHYGFLDEDCNLTSLGTLGAKVRSENELWSSLVLMDPYLEKVSPVSLAAILGSTLMETTRPDVYVAQEVSEEVKEGVNRMIAERVRLFAVQSEHDVEMSICLDPELMGLVELWATGVSWVELLSNTSMQEGDACRILRRVLDLLRQIQHLPVVGRNLKRNARRAVALMDRFPVTDDITYIVSESEKLEANND